MWGETRWWTRKQARRSEHAKARGGERQACNILVWEVPIFVTAGEAITHTSEPVGRGEESVLLGTPLLGAPLSSSVGSAVTLALVEGEATAGIGYVRGDPAPHVIVQERPAVPQEPDNRDCDQICCDLICVEPCQHPCCVAVENVCVEYLCCNECECCDDGDSEISTALMFAGSPPLSS